MRRLPFVLSALLALGVATPAAAQTEEETVAIIFYAGGGGSATSNMKLVRTKPCKYRLDMFGKPIYEIDFSLLTRAEVREGSPRTEIVLYGANSLFAMLSGTERMKDFTILQTGAKRETILNAIAHLQKNYCPARILN